MTERQRNMHFVCRPLANVAGTLRVPSAGYGTRSVPATF